MTPDGTPLSMPADRSAGSMEGADEPRLISASPRWFGLGLVVLVILGIAVRIAFAIVWQDGKPLYGRPAALSADRVVPCPRAGICHPFSR